MENPSSRRCRKCGNIYPPEQAEVFFASCGGSQAKHRTRPVCIGCDQDTRDRKKAGNRWMVKARDTQRRHASRFIMSGVIKHSAELETRFGWLVDQLAHDAEVAYRDCCAYCHKPFGSMGHGLRDIQLDIRDRNAMPHYGGNTVWCCATCNNGKGRLNALQWSAKLAAYRGWEQNQKTLEKNPWAKFPLFREAV
jgi:hypothetical protein